MKRFLIAVIAAALLLSMSIFPDQGKASSKEIVLFMPSTTNNYLAEYAKGFCRYEPFCWEGVTFSGHLLPDYRD